MTEIWVDCQSGASGDMLLGALVSAGVPLAVIEGAVDAVAPERLSLRADNVTRNGLAATHVRVLGTESHHHRGWAEVRELLDAANLDEVVRAGAHETFRRLAEAEARMHATTPDEVHFHEVGALDAIADVVGVCAGLAYLGARAGGIQATPVAVGSGSVRAAHGLLPVPVPAVVELLAAAGAPSHSGQIGDDPVGELCTPTGAALLATHVNRWGPQPPMRVTAQGFGAGTRDTPGRANVVRLVVGEPASGDGTSAPQALLETNVDDLDPRIWPTVLARLLDGGAADAWLTPILMKKGRPGHTLSVLADHDRVDELRRIVFTETTAIGLRTYPVTKQALPREVRTVEVFGSPVRVKVAMLDGRVVNSQPEYEDVLAIAESTGRPVSAVLRAVGIELRY